MNRCIHFPRCGGCSRLDVPYREQLHEKQRVIANLFSPFTNNISPIISSPEQYYYRHKVQLPFSFSGRGTTGRPLVGCYGADSHKVIDQRMCLIQNHDCSKIIWTVREWARRTRLSVFNERSGKGFLRHVLLRRGAGTGEILIGLVTNGRRPEGSRQLAGQLLAMVDDSRLKGSTVVGIIQNVNTRDTNIVLGSEEQIWWGRPYLKETMGELRYKIGLSTFFQVNPFQTPQLYNEVLSRVPDNTRVVDCYCGVGSIALWISQKAAAVLGIEENRAAVQAARTAAKINKCGNVAFHAGDVGAELFRMSQQGYICAIVDPPRKGLAEGLAQIVISSTLERLIYVSCNPQTLKRDVELLNAHFKLTSIRGIDMFPHTDHIECVAVLDRR